MLDRLNSNAILAFAVVNFRPQAKGTVRAFLLRDCIWYRHDGREGIGLPAKCGDGAVDFIPFAPSARRQFQAAALAAAVMAIDEETAGEHERGGP
jgi:hypothetical protein